MWSTGNSDRTGGFGDRNPTHDVGEALHVLWKTGQYVGMECGEVVWKVDYLSEEDWNQEPQGQISFLQSPPLSSCWKRGNHVFPAMGQAAVRVERPLSWKATQMRGFLQSTVLSQFRGFSWFFQVLPSLFNHSRRFSWDLEGLLFHTHSSKSRTKRLVFSLKGSNPTGPCHSTARNARRRHVHAWRLEKGRCSTLPQCFDWRASFPCCLSALKAATTFVFCFFCCRQMSRFTKKTMEVGLGTFCGQLFSISAAGFSEAEDSALWLCE